MSRSRGAAREWVTGFLDRGGTILLVSHDLGAVGRWCREVLWIDSGRVRMRGSAREVIASYVDAVDHESDAVADAEGASGGHLLETIRLVDEAGSLCSMVPFGATVVLEVEPRLPEDVVAPSLEVRIRRIDGVVCYETRTGDEGDSVRP